MNKLILLGLLGALTVVFAVETRTWRQADFAEMEKGSLRRLTLRSDGQLSLAPAAKELFDAGVPYLWAVARDSKGNLYTGGGSVERNKAKVFRVDGATGKSSVAAELDGLEVHAIAVNAKDEVFAATAPDGKVYRLKANGQAEVFCDPHAKYIWALAFAASGDLFVATGDKGEIFRVTPSGQSSVFFDTGETHARSLAVDSQGNLIVGTEPNGLVIRVTPAGAGFVLYQTSKREVTAVAVEQGGVVWAAAVGNRGSATPVAPIAAPAQAAGPTPAAAAVAAARPATPPVPAAAALPAIAGGSEVYRIEPDGYARRVWSHATELAYALLLDSAGRPVIATGNRGGIYRVDANLKKHALLLSLAPTQVTQMVPGSGGAIFAVTGNIGKLYQIGPGLEADGVFESDILDAGALAVWGRASAGMAGVKLETRSGNLNPANKNWSPWVAANAADGRVMSPAARFLQYRLTLSSSSAAVAGIDIAYQARNLAPVVEAVEGTPANYKFPAPAVAAVATPGSLTLPAIGQRSNTSRAAAGASADAPAMTYAKGSIGARWSASDENGDVLSFKLEIRGVNETEWKPLRDKLRERYYSWDSTAFADGEYVVRVTATDAPSNTPEQALSASAVSEPFLVDNTPPVIANLSAAAGAGANRINVQFEARDALSKLARAEYSLNGGDWTVCEPVTRLSDAKELRYQFAIDRPAGTGEFTLAVRVTDENDNSVVSKLSGK